MLLFFKIRSYAAQDSLKRTTWSEKTLNFWSSYFYLPGAIMAVRYYHGWFTCSWVPIQGTVQASLGLYPHWMTSLTCACSFQSLLPWISTSLYAMWMTNIPPNFVPEYVLHLQIASSIWPDTILMMYQNS